MKITRVPWGLAACLMLWVSTGCVNETGVIRAQNSEGVQTADGIYQPGYHIQQTAGYADPYASQSCQSCGGNGCNTCFGSGCYNPDWYPTHHHWYRYKPPKNLVYPPANQPGGVVVYPYYTLKGPDDFFFKG